MEALLQTSNGVVNPPATSIAFSDTATSNSLEGGFITIDETSTVTPPLGTAASYNTGFQGVAGAELDRGNWLTAGLPNTRKPADFAGGSANQAARAGAKLAADSFLRPAPVILQPIADSEEGGSIELAIGAPSPVTDGDGSLLAGQSTEDAAQHLSEIRPESGVGLFCDIEVSVAPTLPMVGSAAAATAYQNRASYVAGMGIHGRKANVATEFAPPLTRSSQASMAGLADRLPLLLGATVLVSQGGLRLEEKFSQRQRRLRSSNDLRQSR
jgi:hypothetical protein